ncbi:MAG: alpha/beta hydrolase domain-containing protein [Dehalococcoidia bacterium]
MPVTGFKITLRRPIADGREFGDVGAYEEIKGILKFAVDPEHPANERIADIKLAPRNVGGLVEFESDLAIVAPLDPSRGNNRMLLDVVNRGNRVSVPMFNLGVRPLFGGVHAEEPNPEIDPGNGFLMRHGYSIISCGWQNDLPPFEGLIGMRSQDATNPDGSPITGRIWSQLQRGVDVPSMMLSDRDHRPYSVVDMEEQSATLTVRDMPDLPPETINRDRWRFGRIDDNGNYVADSNYVSLDGGFEKGRLYQVAYTTSGARVLGLGFAALRDCTSWIKHGSADDENPLAGHIDYAFSYGISQTGRLMRTFIYDDLNQDEEGREALDGIISNVAGGMRGEFNQRFGQNSKDRNNMMVHMFPFTDRLETDPETEETGSLMGRFEARGSTTRVFFTNSSAEYHRGDASLLHTDPDGTRDVEHGENVRIYHFGGTQHGLGVWPPTDRNDMMGEAGQNSLNQIDYSPALRGALVNLDRWVTESLPAPVSSHPRLDDGTAVPPEELAPIFARIPGAHVPDRYALPRRLDFGADKDLNQTHTLPAIPGKAFSSLVSAVDADGNEIAGIRMPEVTVPLATHTGWNLRHPDNGGERQLFVFMGSTIPFAKTRAAREAAGDPRPSIEERYSSRDAYLSQIGDAATAVADEGYILTEDIDDLVTHAADRWDYYTNGHGG